MYQRNEIGDWKNHVISQKATSIYPVESLEQAAFEQAKLIYVTQMVLGVNIC